MNCRLTIGVASMQPGVRILLGQLGVAAEAIARWDTLAACDYSAILINVSLDSAQVAAVDAYVKSGGAVLDTGHFLPRVEPGAFRRGAARPVVRGAADDVFADIWLADIGHGLPRREGSRHLGAAAYLGQRGEGFVAYLPFDLHRLITDTHARRTQFYTPYSRLPNEIVACVSKGELRKALDRGLRWLHAERGLPYLHRWYFPDRLPGIFAYRIDTDYGTRPQLLALYEAARRHAIRMTWFVHVEAHRDYLEVFGEMGDQEIGVHCFRHKTFESFEENDANIGEAAHLLAQAGIHAEGYAAPNGFWNNGLARAVEHNGFAFSSEFSLDYDNLPFAPWAGGAFMHALQVPAHPVCIGSFLRVKAGDAAMKSYFRWIIDRKLQEREPVVLYHHPGHEKADVMEDSFAYANELGLRNLTMGEYARWWRARGGVRYTASYDDGALTVAFASHDPAVQLALHAPDGRTGFLAGDGTWRMEDITLAAPPERRVEMPGDIARMRRFNPLLARHALEDFNSRARQ